MLRTLLDTLSTKKAGALGFVAFVVGYLDMTGEIDALPAPWPRVITFLGALLAYLGFSPVGKGAPAARDDEAAR